ncbi:RHS repeat-associated core domain-containing protein [Mucilaginibacter sp. OK268]|nr:RHS repeat-associated core domain-containing protein [Mucilaginibacter sp. OK268]
MLYALSLKAQTQVTAPMTGTPAAGSYFSYSSIALSPGFSFTAAAGSSLSLYIANPDCQPLGTALSQNQNYILSSVPRNAGYNPAVNTYSTCELMQTVSYFDGLGRPLQTIQVKGSPLNKDMVQPIAYDQFGRETTKYLPYAATTADGSYKTDALITGISSFYNPTGNGTSGTQQSNGIVVIPQPFAQTNFEPSPLNRVVEQGAPGTAWQPVAGNTTGHTVKMVYTINNLNAFSGTDTAVSMRVTLYNATINSNQSRTLTIGNTSGNYYPAGQLYVTVSKDENWKSGRGGTTEEYKDKEGHVVLKRTFNYTAGALQMLSTYYVYDDLGNLAFVLPPLSGADAGITSTANQPVLDNLCYQYQYDERNRLSRKRLPGKDWEYMVYNKLDQPVLSQDAVQRASKQWTVTKYDALGRVIMTGLWTDAAALSQSQLQTNIYNAAQWDVRNTSDINTGYSITSYPALSSSLSINYYDDYSFSNITGFPAKFGTMPFGGSTQTKGLLTASKVNILGSTNMLWGVSYYDGFGRNIQTYKQHYLGGGTPNANNYDVITTGYDFTNAVTSTTRQHYNATNTTNAVLTIANLYYYDHMGRKVQTKEQINGGTTVLLSQTDYNEIGQLKTKHLHSTNNGSSFLQNISYAYNERGWLSQVNDPSVAPAADKLFSMALNYNTPVPAHNVSSQYNGNISEQLYNKGAAGLKYVTYNYDQLNRLTAGNSVEAFSENGITYDANGNIKTMIRLGPNAGTLTYNYGSTNQLASVSGGITRSYGYDANGNATSDGQGNTITYNLLNLPQTITGKGLTYTYDASGQKLRKISGTTITEYIGGIQYTGAGIDFVQTEEGRVLNPTSSPNYEYTLTDHLGNNRVTFDQTNGKKSEDDYYPFGLNVPRGTIPSLRNHYLYNKKELQDELNQYDYGARFYDPVIARWTSVDPLAENFLNHSPYNFVANNPIVLIDPDGRNVTTIDGGVRFDNVNTNDAVEAFKLLTGRTKNAYVDVEGDKSTRGHVNQANKSGFYGQWSVFSVSNIGVGLNALQALHDASGNSLDNLVLETHGGQEGTGGESSFAINDIHNTTNPNYIYDSNLLFLMGTDYTGNPQYDAIKSKVAPLLGMANLVTDGGRFIIAACNIGMGKGGQQLGRDLNKITGNRLNIFLPNGWVTEPIGKAKDGSYTDWIEGSFGVNNSPGWLQTSPNGNQRTIEKIKMNRQQGPPIQIVK